MNKTEMMELLECGNGYGCYVRAADKLFISVLTIYNLPKTGDIRPAIERRVWAYLAKRKRKANK